MKLTYRGVSYDYNPPTVETTDGELGGKFRGLDWRFRNLKKPPVLQPTANLTYRGVTYNKAGTTVETQEAVSVPTRSTQDIARTRMMNQTRSIKNRQQAMLSRLAAEVGVPDAQDYWNRIQGKVHPTFRTNYTRHGAAMS